MMRARTSGPRIRSGRAGLVHALVRGMKTLKISMMLTGFLLSAAPAFADEPIRPDRGRDSRSYERPDDYRDDRDRRDHAHADDRRGGRDFRYGHLSPAERRRVADYEAYVMRLEREAWYDGYVSRGERIRINRARNTLEGMIQRERYDGNRR